MIETMGSRAQRAAGIEEEATTEAENQVSRVGRRDRESMGKNVTNHGVEYESSSEIKRRLIRCSVVILRPILVALMIRDHQEHQEHRRARTHRYRSPRMVGATEKAMMGGEVLLEATQKGATVKDSR